MGEIVDLERYRRQRKRRSPDSEAARDRRIRERKRPRGERSGPALESGEAGRADLDRVAKIDRDDQTAD